MAQQAANRRLARDAADQFYGRGVEALLHRDGFAFGRVEDRLKFYVAFEGLPAALLQIAHGGPYLRVRIGRNVLREEIYQPPVALEDGEYLNGPVASIGRGRLDGLRGRGGRAEFGDGPGVRGRFGHLPGYVSGNLPVRQEVEEGSKGVRYAFTKSNHNYSKIESIRGYISDAARLPGRNLRSGRKPHATGSPVALAIWTGKEVRARINSRKRPSRLKASPRERAK